MWQLVGTYLFVLSILSSCDCEARPETLVSKLENQYQQQQSQNYQNFGSASSLTRLPDRLLADVDYFDKLDVDSQLNNKRFVDLQVKCLVYDGPCDIFGRKAKGEPLQSKNLIIDWYFSVFFI